MQDGGDRAAPRAAPATARAPRPRRQPLADLLPPTPPLPPPPPDTGIWAAEAAAEAAGGAADASADGFTSIACRFGCVSAASTPLLFVTLPPPEVPELPTPLPELPPVLPPPLRCKSSSAEFWRALAKASSRARASCFLLSGLKFHQNREKVCFGETFLAFL